jgi:hypothetical protein
MDSIKNLSVRSSLGWQRAYLKIVNKKSQLVPLIHNIAQLKVHNTLQLQRERGLPVRGIVLKARQFGVSTYIEARNFEDTHRRSNRHACIISADADSTNKVFRMCRTFMEELPRNMQRPLDFSNRKEIVYSKPHRSSLLCQTAGKDVLGRGGTTHLIHATEVAFWPNADVAMLGLLQEVPKEVDSIGETDVVIESTACGTSGYFHDKYWQAVDRMKKNSLDLNGFVPIFLPWHIFPEYRMPLLPEMGGHLQLIEDEPYCEVSTVELLRSKNIILTDEQLYWRRYTIDNDCGGDLGKFKQEYPATAREAFQSTGKMIFIPAVLDRMEKHCRPAIARITFEESPNGKITHRTVNRSEDCWYVWKWPERNHEYAAYGDVCEGLLADPNNPKSDPDYHAGAVLDRNTLEIVMTYHGRCDTIEYGEQLHHAAKFFNFAVASPEVNSCGLAVLNELKRRNYPNIFTRQGKEEELVEEDTSKLGYKTTTLNRKPGIETLKKAVKDGDLKIYDKRIIDEMRVFVNNNGKPEAESGYHDDWVMMLVGLLQIHLLAPIDGADLEQASTSDRSENKLISDEASLAMIGACDPGFDDVDDMDLGEDEEIGSDEEELEEDEE